MRIGREPVSEKFKGQSWEVSQKYNELDTQAAFCSAIPRGIFPAPLQRMPPRDLLNGHGSSRWPFWFSVESSPTHEAQEAIVQLRKSANSVRSNYRAARKGRSRAEFESKLHIAFEEADECVDWLEYSRDGKIQEDPALLQEAKELAAILGAADRTARKNTARIKRVPRASH